MVSRLYLSSGKPIRVIPAHLYTQENEPVVITITDVVGRKLQEYSATTNAEIPVKVNAPGIYLVTAATAGGRYMAKVLAE